jgi:phosphoenolpyruvate synthase/pyruvate phosphate dikinase
LSAEDTQAVEQASQAIRSLFERAALPEEAAAEIRSAYQALCSNSSAASFPEPANGDLPVAVRSSATAEDLPGLAFTGQRVRIDGNQGRVTLLED